MRPNLVLLEHLAADVKREVVRVNHSFHEVQVSRQEVVELVRDENLSHVQLQAPLAVLCDCDGRRCSGGGCLLYTSDAADE